jgi:hypothetical protein
VEAIQIVQGRGTDADEQRLAKFIEDEWRFLKEPVEVLPIRSDHTLSSIAGSTVYHIPARKGAKHEGLPGGFEHIRRTGKSNINVTIVCAGPNALYYYCEGGLSHSSGDIAPGHDSTFTIPVLAPGDVRLDARYGDTDCALFVDPTSPPNPLTVTVDIKKLLTGPFV